MALPAAWMPGWVPAAKAVVLALEGQRGLGGVLSKSCMVTWGGGEEVGAGLSPVLWKSPPGCSLQAGGPRMVLDESPTASKGLGEEQR